MSQPANRLPPEILSDIVDLVVSENFDRDTQSVLLMSHVCQHWHESIVSTRGNWTRISSESNSELTSLALERSGSAHLQVVLHTDNIEGNPKIPELIKPHIPKITTLWFICDGLNTAHDLLQTLPDFPHSTPNLRVLKLQKIQFDNSHWDPSLDPFKPFPATLRKLYLEDIRLYPSFNSVRNLIRFDLSNCAFDQPIDELLDFIHQNTSLEEVELRIDDTGSALGTYEPSRDGPINAKLKQLSVTSRDVEIARALISGIAFEGGARLAVNTMELDWGHFFEFFGPNGSVRSQGNYLEMSTAGYPIALKSIERLLVTNSPATLDPSLFPNIKILAFNMMHGASDLLSRPFSCPDSFPSLETLIFVECHLTEVFMERLVRYFSERKKLESTRLTQIKIVPYMNPLSWMPKLSDDLINELRSHVPVDVLPADKGAWMLIRRSYIHTQW